MITAHPRLYRALIVLLILLALACAWLFPLPLRATGPLHLEATSSRSELLTGDQFVVDAYLFNDGATPILATLGIQAPAGFDLIRVTPTFTTTPEIAAGRALRSSWVYRVRSDAPKGPAPFAVVAFNDSGLPTQATAVVVRVQPVVAPPAVGAPVRPQYLPAIRR